MLKIRNSLIIFAVLFFLSCSTVQAKETPYVKYKYYSYIKEVCADYNMSPEFVCSVIWHETRWQNVASGEAVGLMQICHKWHAERMEKLGVTDLMDEEQNILVGIDYLYELFEKYSDPYLVLMMYNMRSSTALHDYENGNYSDYAVSVTEVSAMFERNYRK